MDKRIVLLGHSASGKSACMMAMGCDPVLADMDRAFDTNKSPPAKNALRWMTNTGQPAVAVSVHKQMLKDIVEARQKGEYADLFDQLLFIYLRVDQKEHRRRLALNKAEGSTRSASNVQETMASYLELDNCFLSLADLTINATRRDGGEVVELIRRLLPDA